MQQPLCLDTLGDLDGGAGRAIIDAAIAEALRDLDDRGNDEQARKVLITVSLKQMENGLVETHVEAAAKIPNRRTASTIGRLKRDGKQQSRLLFQDLAPEDPDQRTIDETFRGQNPTEGEV